MKTSNILITKPSSNYALLDSGEGEKLERFGQYTLARPDPQALWRKRLSLAEWKKADGYFTRDEKKGDWVLKRDMPERWRIDFGGLKLWIKPTAFKHAGLFPEQVSNWKWLVEVISKNITAPRNSFLGHKSPGDHFSSPAGFGKGDSTTLLASNEFRGAADAICENIEILNLFGYTGGATLACARAGASVVHIDGSKSAVVWARDNAEISGLTEKPVRWIVEDARTFVDREIKRGRKYDGIIMDPPAFGHGPDNELWKIEEHLLPLIENCFKLLSKKPLLFLINGYSAGYSALAYENVLLPLVQKFGGNVEVGELAIEESKDKKLSARILPCGIFARWSIEEDEIHR